ncbi:MAG: VCBS repeat-containing protein, partial [Lewinella sp.]|nr:VCBS repeat-containing protein [Lewinella sp.]
VYANDTGTLTRVWEEPLDDNGWYADTSSVAWGDWNGDGDLDLALGNWGDAPSRVYANNGKTLILDWEESPGVYARGSYADTRSVAWGDWDGDGDLDLALGNSGAPSQVYSNDAGTLTLAWEEPPGVYALGGYADTLSVAWGDWDGDGDLDLALGNASDPRRVFVIKGGPCTLVCDACPGVITL